MRLGNICVRLLGKDGGDGVAGADGAGGTGREKGGRMLSGG